MLRKTLTLAIILAGLLLVGSAVDAQIRIKDVCRVKGQEQNTLRGLGLVIGLNKTGDNGDYAPMIRSLARAYQLMGNPVGGGRATTLEKQMAAELKETKNVAIVWVDATIPASGARQGDRIDCRVVSCGNAKSLSGGRLLATALQGPRSASQRIYAFAEGNIFLDNAAGSPLNGKVTQGCRLEEDFYNAFLKDGKFTLVLDEYKRDFQVAQNIAQLIGTQLRLDGGGTSSDNLEAKAIDASNIVADIPPQYRKDPVQFLAQVLALPLPVEDLRTAARVVISERANTMVISGDVEIGAVVVTHKNIRVDTGAGQFIAIDPAERLREKRRALQEDASLDRFRAAKLKSLVEALNAADVPKEDAIEIVKQIYRLGKLHARLVIE